MFSSNKVHMKVALLLISLVSCASYTDPEQESLTYYKCEKNQTIVVRYSDDYESVRIKVGKEQLLLHHFVLENGDGYRSEKYLWMVKGKKAKLMTLKNNGTEEVVLGECKAEKADLDF